LGVNRSSVEGVLIRVPLLSTPGHSSERAVQRLVNFGTVSLARVLGDPPEELLQLRCECGARGCAATVEATAAEHRDDACCLFMVAREHAAAVPGRVVASNERFAMVRVADQPSASWTRRT
jgi:hypothetical protein